jgi:hypothetical protein
LTRCTRPASMHLTQASIDASLVVTRSALQWGTSFRRRGTTSTLPEAGQFVGRCWSTHNTASSHTQAPHPGRFLLEAYVRVFSGAGKKKAPSRFTAKCLISLHISGGLGLDPKREPNHRQYSPFPCRRVPGYTCGYTRQFRLRGHAIFGENARSTVLPVLSHLADSGGLISDAAASYRARVAQKEQRLRGANL